MKKFGKWILFLVLWAVIGGGIGYGVHYFYDDLGSLEQYIMVGAGALALIYIFIGFTKLDAKKVGGDSDGSESAAKKKNKDKKQDELQFFQGSLLTEAEMKKKFIYCRYSELKKQDMFSKQNKMNYKGGAGVVIKAELIGKPFEGKDLTVCMAPAINTLVVGNTRSGKGESFVIPNLQCNSELNSKPSFVITDPKGELYDKHVKKLKRNGYQIKVYDLRKPFESDRWNPLSHIYDTYQRAVNLKKECYKHSGSDPKKYNLEFDPNGNYSGEWFEFDGKAYISESDMVGALNGRYQELIAQVSSDVKDIVNIIISESDPKNAMWVAGARDFASAVLFSMLEDSLDPDLGMTKDRFNLANFYRICNIKSDDPDDSFSILRDYFDGRSTTFGIKELSNAVTTSSPTTASSFLATLTPALGLFADPGVQFLTSCTEIKFDDIATKPTAFFIKTTDEKVVMDKIAAMCIEQLYTELVAQANKFDGVLPRAVIYMLDEFANLPKIEKMSTYISVCAGRNIFFYIIIQDYSQLDSKYGPDVAKTIKNNCNIKFFVGSNEMNTMKEFSELCGKTTVMVDDVNTTKNKDGKQESKSESKATREQQRDLIFVEELQLLKEDHLVVVMAKEKPLKTICTRSYKCKNVYEIGGAGSEYKPLRSLDTEKFFYSIQKYLDKHSSRSSSRW